ncbi:MAG: zinc ribbon domain-containing protein [Planctomycetes bacterium]|nr:zinc ribbon domain-containing protein [Planctomycetota bacterium]
MGLFTNKCLNPGCDHRVRKGSKFCPKCGSAAPRGLASCGGCGAEVRTSSKFCWRCGAELATVTKPLILGERWARHPEDFAVRVDDPDIKGCLVKPLVVEHGTRALLFQDGQFKGELGEGRYDMDGFLARLGRLLIDKNVSVVLVDAGDVALDLENGNLWTSDPFEVGSCARLVIRVRAPEVLFVNLFKGRSRVTLEDIEGQLAGEAQMVLSGIAAGHRAQDLFGNLGLRNQVEAQLRDAIQVTFQRLGLELAQLRFIDFTGEAFERLRTKQQELAVAEAEAGQTEQRAKLNQRLREVLTQDKMDAFKSEKDLEDFIRQTEHELGLKQVIRQDEMERLRQRFQFERDREGLLRRIEVEGIASDERREQAWKELLSEERQRDERHARELERGLGTARSAAERRKIEIEIERLEHEEDVRQAEEGLRLLRDVKAIEREEAVLEQELEAKRLAERSRATAEALLSIVDGPAAERIAQIEALRQQQKMTPEQILALAAAASPQAAEALAQKYRAEGQLSAEKARLLEQQIAEQRQMAEGYADRMERMMQTALTQMGGVATARARPVEPRQTVVVPGGGLGAPVVVAPGPTQAGALCKHCGAPLEGAGEFCPSCGKKQ